ncbi:hypothetical protein [Kaarinaea lacus]
MRHIVLASLLPIFIGACSGGNTEDNDGNNASQDTNISPGSLLELNANNSVALANQFCANRNMLQVLSTSLLSAYSVKDNGSDLNYCGGSIGLDEEGLNFDINISDYCVNARGQQVTLNGDISGATESGANFTSTINNLTIVGSTTNLSIDGTSWDGRADDMFISLNVFDHAKDEQLYIDDVSIKKGELDFGYITFSGMDATEFKFIDYFNAELTQGQVFFYGTNDEILILSADNGAITAVLKQSKTDSGTLLNTNCDS